MLKTRQRSLRWGIGVLMLGTLGSGAGAQTPTVVTVALMAPLSGPLAGMGQEVRNALELSMAQARPTFRAQGLDLRLKVYDDQNSPERGRKLAQDLVQDEEVVALVGPLTSEVALPVSEVLSKANVGMVSSAGGSFLSARALENFNRLTAPETASGQVAVDYMASTLGVKTVYVLSDDGPYGRALAQEVLLRCDAKNIKLAGLITVRRAFDMDVALESIRGAGADAIFYAGEYDMGLEVFRKLSAAKVGGIWFGGDALNVAAFWKGMGAMARGMYLSTSVAPAAAYPKAATWVQAYQSKYQQKPTGLGILAHDALEVVLEGVQQSSSAGKRPSRQRVQTALRKANVRGALSGEISFTARGERQNASVFVLGIGSDLQPRVHSSLKVGAK